MIESLLRAWGRVVVRWPGAILAACGLGAAVALWLGLTRLEVQTDPDELVSSEADYYRRYKQDYLGRFPDAEYCWVAVEVAGQPERAVAFARDLSARLRGAPGVVFSRFEVDLSPLARAPLALLPDAELAAARTRLLAARDDLRRLARARDLPALLGGVVERAADLAVGGEEQAGDREAFAFLDGLLADAERALAGEEPTGEGLRAFLPGAGGPGPVVRLFDTDPRQDPTGAAARYLLVAVQVEKDFSTLAVIEAPLRRVREALDATRAAFPGVAAGLTGRPVLAADEMLSTSRDANTANGLSFTLVFLIFVAAFRSLWRPLVVMACLGLGLVWAAGFAALAVGSLNLLSMAFTAILIGLGVEFGVHVLARHCELRARGATTDEAVVETFVAVGPGNLTGALAAAAAFLATRLVDFEGLAQLGLICAGGLGLCLVAMHTALPAALVLGERWRPGPVEPPVVARFVGRLDRLGGAVAALGVLVALLALVPGWRVRFDERLLDLQDPRLESVQWERRLSATPGLSSWFGVFLCEGGEAQARRVDAALRARTDLVARTESALDLLAPPGRQAALEALARELGGPLAPPREPARALAAADAGPLRERLGELGGLLERLEGRAAGAGDPLEARRSLGALRARAGRVDAALAALGPTPAGPRWEALSAWQRALLDGLGGFVDAVLRPAPLALADLPAELRERLVAADGTFAVYAYPREDLWDPAALARFHAFMREVDPRATGVPVMVARSIAAMREGFVTAFGYATLLVVAFVVVDLRRAGATLLALLPVSVGLLWSAGLAGLLGLSLNLANFFAVPILVGVAVDNGVHLVHRWRLAPHENPGAGPTGMAIVLTSLTSIVGFGSLAVAGHRGLASLGVALALGMTACLAASLLVLPPLLGWLGRRGAPAPPPPPTPTPAPPPPPAAPPPAS